MDYRYHPSSPSYHNQNQNPPINHQNQQYQTSSYQNQQNQNQYPPPPTNYNYEYEPQTNHNYQYQQPINRNYRQLPPSNNLYNQPITNNRYQRPCSNINQFSRNRVFQEPYHEIYQEPYQEPPLLTQYHNQPSFNQSYQAPYQMQDDSFHQDQRSENDDLYAIFMEAIQQSNNEYQATTQQKKNDLLKSLDRLFEVQAEAKKNSEALRNLEEQVRQFNEARFARPPEESPIQPEQNLQQVNVIHLQSEKVHSSTTNVEESSQKFNEDAPIIEDVGSDTDRDELEEYTRIEEEEKKRKKSDEEKRKFDEENKKIDEKKKHKKKLKEDERKKKLIEKIEIKDESSEKEGKLANLEEKKIGEKVKMEDHVKEVDELERMMKELDERDKSGEKERMLVNLKEKKLEMKERYEISEVRDLREEIKRMKKELESLKEENKSLKEDVRVLMKLNEKVIDVPISKSIFDSRDLLLEESLEVVRKLDINDNFEKEVMVKGTKTRKKCDKVKWDDSRGCCVKMKDGRQPRIQVVKRISSKADVEPD